MHRAWPATDLQRATGITQTAFVRNATMRIHRQSDSKPQTRTTLPGVRAETQMLIFLKYRALWFLVGPFQVCGSGLVGGKGLGCLTSSLRSDRGDFQSPSVVASLQVLVPPGAVSRVGTMVQALGWHNASVGKLSRHHDAFLVTYFAAHGAS